MYIILVMKRIVICCDGTWNTPDQKDRGVMRPINVVKRARIVLPQTPDGIEQLHHAAFDRMQRDPARYKPENLADYVGLLNLKIDLSAEPYAMCM